MKIETIYVGEIAGAAFDDLEEANKCLKSLNEKDDCEIKYTLSELSLFKKED